MHLIQMGQVCPGILGGHEHGHEHGQEHGRDVLEAVQAWSVPVRSVVPVVVVLPVPAVVVGVAAVGDHRAAGQTDEVVPLVLVAARPFVARLPAHSSDATDGCGRPGTTRGREPGRG